uniref:Uncharacterized protein n=1 Tax=Strombidium rassoulzadegani TaxID=1082188 RepID=A0A7S3CI72_9SPIT|mmetsp:Transcript_11423/g.19293  ORF Transcript_11423/g.19293 Transcript_11423/m.19293 type:complete len:608 (+) Transcript_11423:653-2476(+)
MDLVDAHGVIDHLDQPAVGPRGQDLVSLEPERQLLDLEDLVDLLDQLHGELLLPHVVHRLHDHSHQVPRPQLSEGRVLPDAQLLLSRLLPVEALQVDHLRLGSLHRARLHHLELLLLRHHALLVAFEGAGGAGEAGFLVRVWHLAVLDDWQVLVVALVGGDLALGVHVARLGALSLLVELLLVLHDGVIVLPGVGPVRLSLFLLLGVADSPLLVTSPRLLLIAVDASGSLGLEADSSRLGHRVPEQVLRVGAVGEGSLGLPGLLVHILELVLAEAEVEVVVEELLALGVVAGCHGLGEGVARCLDEGVVEAGAGRGDEPALAFLAEVNLAVHEVVGAAEHLLELLGVLLLLLEDHGLGDLLVRRLLDALLERALLGTLDLGGEALALEDLLEPLALALDALLELGAPHPALEAAGVVLELLLGVVGGLVVELEVGVVGVLAAQAVELLLGDGLHGAKVSEQLLVPVLLEDQEHLVRPVDFDGQHDGRALLGLEYARLLGGDVEHAEVAGGVLHEGDVNAGGEVLVNLDQLLLQDLHLRLLAHVLHLPQHRRHLRQALHELGCREERVQPLPLLLGDVGVLGLVVELVLEVDRIDEGVDHDVLRVDGD